MAALNPETIVLCFQLPKGGEVDLEVPLGITVNELIAGISQGLKISPGTFLRSENPIAFLQGDTPLEEYGLRDGTLISN